MHRGGGPARGRITALTHLLQAEEFLYEQPPFPESAYTFKDVLTQEVAYNTVLLERRRVCMSAPRRPSRGSGRIAWRNTIIRWPIITDAVGTPPRRSTTSPRRQQAVERSAYAEAISHLSTALDLLTTLPETREHRRQELVVQMTLGMALRATKGAGAPEVGTAVHPGTRAV